MLDAMQVLKACYDSTKEALRITGVAGSLDGQITWNTGLGAITHILGPTDQPLLITSNPNRNATLQALGTGHAVLSASHSALTIEDGAAGNAGLNVGAGTLTLTGTNVDVAGLLRLGSNVEFTGAAPCTVTGTNNQNLSLSAAGTGHAVLKASNSAITVEDGVTGAITLGCSTGTLTLTAGLVDMTTSAQKVKSLAMQAGVGGPPGVITVGATDYVIGVDCSGAAITVNLEAAATAGTGRILVIKDQSGNAGANNITITPSGAEKIDEAATVVISANYGSVTLVCLGTAGNEWSVI